MRMACLRQAISSVGAALMVLGGLAGGCQDGSARMRSELGPAADIGTASMANLGWRRGSGRLEEASFSAVVTTYDREGKAFSDLQEMAFDFEHDSLTSAGRTPQGAWRARVWGGDHLSLSADAGADKSAVRQRMGPVLVTLRHRLRGPYNLVGHRQRARDAKHVNVGGANLVRVSIDGDNRKAIAYYFDAGTGLLQHVTADADTPGQKGTVTTYEYAALPNGLVFPKMIRIARLGRHVLLGETPILEVEISEVRPEVKRR